MLDIRTPIGVMFLLLGGLLGVYGMFTPHEMYKLSLGYNVNLLWGGVMAIFGFCMLVWRLTGMRPQPAVVPVEVEPPVAEETATPL